MISQVDVNMDKRVFVRYSVPYKSSFLLYFNFKTNGISYDVSAYSFVFTVLDEKNKIEKLKINNADWSRPEISIIQKQFNPIMLAPAVYNIDFTGIFNQGKIQPLASGILIIKPRSILN